MPQLAFRGYCLAAILRYDSAVTRPGFPMTKACRRSKLGSPSGSCPGWVPNLIYLDCKD